VGNIGYCYQLSPLEDVAELRGGFAFKSADYSESGRFVLRTLNIQDDGSITRNDAVYLPLSKTPQYQRFELEDQDTLFVMVGATLGKIGYIRASDLPALLNQNMWLIRGREKLCDKRYIHYAFRHCVGENLGFTTGSAREFARRNDYRKLKVPSPPLPIQKAIAHILGTLDDRIELCRRMNETLEAMARALFKDWFIDFGPVRAKMDGREPPGLSPEIAALFPDHLVDSELGEIPEGWKISTIGHVANISSGKRPVYRLDVATAECKIPLFGGGGQMGFVSHPLYAKPIIFTGRVGTLGKIFRTSHPSWPSDNTLVIEANDYLFDFTYFFLLEQDLAILNRGSTQPLLTQADLKKQKMALPPLNVLSKFSSISARIFDRISCNRDKITSLSALRDALLPKLLSGELSIPVAMLQIAAYV
jgi:type I restriction enzyme S subunit